MKRLADILKSIPVLALINAKPLAKKNLIFLFENDTIRTALITFTAEDIESIPIRKCSTKTTEFIGTISLVNLLKFIFTANYDLPVPQLLKMELSELVKHKDLIKKIEFIPADSSLLHLLLNIWGKKCHPKTVDIDCLHLFTTDSQGIHDVITPLDFLRHILFLGSNSTMCIKNSPSTELENGFDIEPGFMVTWNDDAKLAMEKMLQSDPYFILAIVNEDTGCLEANITFFDFLPKNPDLLEELVSMTRHSGISIQTYLKTLQSVHTPSSSIDPILLYPHFSIYDIIEKLTRLRIHHLWRVTPDIAKKPIGVVGSFDVLRYLSFMFRPFLQEEDKNISICPECEN